MHRKTIVPLILCLIWFVIVGWQWIEHNRFRDYAQTVLLNRARDITNSLATVVRSQRRFGGVISKSRLESALQDLVKQEELRSIAILNSLGEVVTSAGEPMAYDVSNLPKSGERWEEKSVTFVNLADLGVDQSETDPKKEPPTLILQFPEPGREPGREPRNGPPMGPPGSPEDAPGGQPSSATPEGPPPGERADPPPEGPPPPRPEFYNPMRGAMDSAESASGFIPGATPPWRDDRDGRHRPPRFEDWLRWNKELLPKQGWHGFVLVLSTQNYNHSLDTDLWMRSIIAGFSLLAMAGIGVAWRNLIKTSELQLRLVRASEMNAHLREMNIAAAGLAHETRNPLNIVRGLAQMIAKQDTTPADIRERSIKITEEVDRVTTQLNEFIDYSKPREPKPAPIPLYSIITDVERALRFDMEDKEIEYQISGPEITVDADESLLRQIIFNLMINSIQSVNHHGKIEIVIDRLTPALAYFEVRDNGPGVSYENREKIFQPYFTTQVKGTGLGLAVVRQIVMSHGWNVEYRQNPNGGATFRVSGLKLMMKNIE